MGKHMMQSRRALLKQSALLAAAGVIGAPPNECEGKSWRRG
jgi:hypothetical protein